MAKIESRGKCYFCNKEFPRASMTRHLAACPERKATFETASGKKKSRQEKLFHIFVDGYRVYWLHIEMPASATLADLDQFLRDIWLECCGHLSEFKIGKRSFESHPDADFGFGPFDDDESPLAEEEDATPPTPAEIEVERQRVRQQMIEVQGLSSDQADALINAFLEMMNEPSDEDDFGGSMDVPLGDVLSVGLKFEHTYDFGTSTDLVLTVVAERDGIPPQKTKRRNSQITILARNNPPLITCLKCGKPATKICLECQYPDGGAYCDKCAGKECPGCEDEMYLPVVNSPRMGECGYTGSVLYD